MLRLWLMFFLVALLVQSRTSVGADLVINGSFETPVVPVGAEFLSYKLGTNFGGWTVSASSVDLVVTNYFASAAGIQAVDLNGSDSGAIFQIITNTPGETYRFSFTLAGNPCACGAPIKQMEVRWGFHRHRESEP